jgi:DNA-directed RNA polymerase specialized sigma24 family protein
MSTCLPAAGTLSDDFGGSSWDKLYRILWMVVQGWVYAAHLSSWLGQEEDIIAEIVQEAVCRTFERQRKAEMLEAEAVKSLEYFSKTVARHFFVDLVRKDKRIVHLTQLQPDDGGDAIEFELADVAEEVHEEVMYESLFNELALEIVNFPKKQGQVLLNDIANHMHFDMQRMTRLEKAFYQAGVHLQEYQRPKPADVIERSRYVALLSIAYKRVAQLHSMKRYTSIM